MKVCIHQITNGWLVSTPIWKASPTSQYERYEAGRAERAFTYDAPSELLSVWQEALNYIGQEFYEVTQAIRARVVSDPPAHPGSRADDPAGNPSA